VALAREHECLPHLVDIDRGDGVVGVLGDDRDEVGEELTLAREKLLIAVRQRGDCPTGRLTAVQTYADVRVRKPPGLLAARTAGPAPRAGIRPRGLLAAALALDAVVFLRVRRQAAFALLVGCWSSLRYV
jgi:hypothetical protein